MSLLGGTHKFLHRRDSLASPCLYPSEWLVIVTDSRPTVSLVHSVSKRNVSSCSFGNVSRATSNNAIDSKSNAIVYSYLEHISSENVACSLG